MNTRVEWYWPFVVLVLLFSLPSLSVMAQTAATPENTAIKGESVAADWRTLLDSLSAHPDVLKKDWASLRAVLPAGCFRTPNKRELSCPPMNGVVRVSADPGPQGVVDIVLKPPVTCDHVYSILSKRFGSAHLEDGDKCYSEWKLGKWGIRRGSVSLSPGRKDPTQLYLQFAIEQGP